MFSIIYYFDYILTYIITMILFFFAMITTLPPRLIFTLVTLHFSVSKKLFFSKFFLIKYAMSHPNNSNVNFCDFCNIYPSNQRRVYTGINHTISNIRNYWRKCLSLKKKKKSRRGCIIRMKMIIL